MFDTARAQRNRPLVIVVAVVIAVALLLLVVFEKQRLKNDVTSGPTLSAQFAGSGKLVSTGGLAPASKVKIAGSPVGLVTGVGQPMGGTVRVVMKVKGDTKSELGSTPSATIRPTSLVGGKYYVETGSWRRARDVPGLLHPARPDPPSGRAGHRPSGVSRPDAGRHADDPQ